MEKETKVVKTKKTAAQVADIQVQRVEPKNKVYKLTGRYRKSPWLKLQAEDRKDSRLLATHPKSGVRGALRYAANFESPFIQDQLDYISKGGEITQEQVIFEGRMLGVDKQEVGLQTFMDLHPWNKKNGGNMFYEHDASVIAKEEVDELKVEAEAMKLAFDMDINTASAILRPRVGNGIHTMKTDMVTRELLRMAKQTPGELIELAEDPNLMVRYMAYTSIDFEICTLTDSKQVYRWASTNERLLSIPFGEDAFAFIAKWFTTDEGLEVMNKITQKIKK